MRLSSPARLQRSVATRFVTGLSRHRSAAGGAGTDRHPTREVSEIEECILEGVGQIICRELATVWQPLGVEIEFDQRQPVSQMLRIMPAQEKTLALSFEVTMPDSHGVLNLRFRPWFLTRCCASFDRAGVPARPGPGGEPGEHWQAAAGFGGRAGTGDAGHSGAPEELLTMQTGSVLPLRRHIEEPAMLRLGGRDCWLARPVSSRNLPRRATAGIIPAARRGGINHESTGGNQS